MFGTKFDPEQIEFRQWLLSGTADPAGGDPAGAGTGGSGSGAPAPASGEGAEVDAGDGGVGTDPGETGEGDPNPQASGAPSAPSPTRQQDWRDRRIAKLTAQLKQLRESGAGGATDPGPAAAPGTFTRDDVERLANERAQALASQQIFNERCNQTAQEGRRQFGTQEFNAAISALQETFDAQDQAQQAAYFAMLDAAMETGEGPKILFELGQDQNEASRIMGLSPAKMGLELAKRLSHQPIVPNVSGAPKPIAPVRGGQGRSHDPIDPSDADRADRLSTAEWMKRREEQVRRQEANR